MILSPFNVQQALLFSQGSELFASNLALVDTNSVVLCWATSIAISFSSIFRMEPLSELVIGLTYWPAVPLPPRSHQHLVPLHFPYYHSLYHPTQGFHFFSMYIWPHPSSYALPFLLPESTTCHVSLSLDHYLIKMNDFILESVVYPRITNFVIGK